MRPMAALCSYLARRRYRRYVREGYRIVKVSNPQRIGHLCQEIDCLLKDTLLQGGDPKKLIVINLKDRFGNRHLVEHYYASYVTVTETHPLLDLVEQYGDPESALMPTNDYAVAMYKTAKCYETYAKWGDRPPLFKISDEDRQVLNAYLKAIGFPDGGWYVCLHAREGGYSPSDEDVHRYRSVDIESFSAAVDEIVRRGGWCIRMGDSTMRPYAPHPHVIDYALSPAKTAQLDVALTAGCRFLLGSASGMFSLAEVFGRPCAVAHMAPLACAYTSAPINISIFQGLEYRDGLRVSVGEIMAGDYANYRKAEEFEAAGLQNLPNTPDEIRELAVEMLDRLDGTLSYTSEDEELQAKFKAYYHEGHYSFRAASRIGRDHLRRQMQLEKID